MSRGLPYFPFYPEDFTSDALVEAMTTEEVGAFFLLLCKSWRESPPASVPDDDRILARWARVTMARWKRIRPKILGGPFRQGEDGRWHQKRLRRIYEDLMAKSSRARDAAEKRWEAPGRPTSDSNRQGDASASANALPPHGNGNAGEDAGGVAPFSLSSSTSTRSPFKPPTLEEVKAYWIEKELRGSPEKFFDRHTAGGWRVGKDRMKDWRAAARYWSGNENERGMKPGFRGGPRNAVHRAGQYQDVKSEVLEQVPE